MEFWWPPITYAGGLVVASLITWGLFDSTSAFALLVGGLVFYIIRHLKHLFRLERWLRNPATPQPSENGLWETLYKQINVLLKQRDRQQQQTRADLIQLKHVTDGLPEGTLILDRENRILGLNNAAELHLRLSRTRDIGQFVHYLLRNSRFVEWLTLDDPGQRLLLAAPGKAENRLSLQLVHLADEQRLVISHDITEMERIDSMRRDFVANVSHELRTPITVVAGFLETFDEMEADEINPAAFKPYVRTMREQTDRMRRLLDDLLTLARLEGVQESPNAGLDIRALAQRMRDDALSLSHGRHEIILQLESDSGLLGNEQELYSAFSNLVSNAVRYTPEMGRITLSWRLNAHGGAEFSVSDSGEGIAAQHIPRLTERFYRVDRGRSRATGGTGLGLAIVKHILQRHQGRLRIESTVGKGSTFTALFPAERVIPALVKVPEDLPDAASTPPSNAP